MTDSKEETKNDEQEEKEDEKVEQNQEIEEEEEDGEPHPIDKLAAIIEDIESQERRLGNRNAGDLKYELTRNIYPTLKKIIASVIELALDDEEDEEDEEDEITEEMQKAIENETKEMEDVCKKILEKKDENHEKVVAWAENFLKKLDEVKNASESETTDA